MYAVGKVGMQSRSRSLLGLGRQSDTQYATRLLFHGTTLLCGLLTQALLEVIIDLANSNAVHIGSMKAGE